VNKSLVLTRPLGLFFGKLARRIFDRYGVTAEAERWDYGTASRKTFEPHRSLDGEVFETPDAEVLVNSHSWPPVSHFYPGDHQGCGCQATPTLVSTITLGPLMIDLEEGK
jgi:hypothetical protein